jgi:phosphocarrier protein
VEAQATIVNRRGLHARASAKICAVAAAWDADIRIAKDGDEVNAKSIMGLLMLGAVQGSVVEIRAVGPQAAEAVDTIVKLIADRFGEGE